jgi:ketosteroid isomerase-like protein
MTFWTGLPSWLGGIASLFTSDGLLVMLAPKLSVKVGREAIQKHYEGIIAAGATNLSLEVKQVEARGSDAAWAAGTYSVLCGLVPEENFADH